MPTIADVYRALNSLVEEKVVENYAIGGAMAALFYAEATHIFQISVCTLGLRSENLTAWADKCGFEWRDGLMVIYGVPVRLEEQNSTLEKAAICGANSFDYDGARVRAMSAAHLIGFYEADSKSQWGYCPSYFGMDEPVFDASDSNRFAAKRRWHQNNARLPIKEKICQLLAMQKHDLPLSARRRALKWWEKPWDIEP